MTATDELRRLLDERGVEHYDGTERTLWGYEQTGEDTGIYRFAASEISGGFLQFDMFRITPEQAIAATLGAEDAYTREDVESAFVSGYSLGCLPVGSDPTWDQNEQTVDEHMAEWGWVRKEATLGSGMLTAEQVREAWCGHLMRDCLYDPPTPDWQAIADELNATLGAGTCHDKCSRFNAWVCSECGATLLMMFDDFGEPSLSVDGVADVPHFCPNCGAKVVDLREKSQEGA